MLAFEVMGVVTGAVVLTLVILFLGQIQGLLVNLFGKGKSHD